MTDDFRIFADGTESNDATRDPSIDADTALVTAYLARELTLVQIVAVQQRLATDSAFREHAAPIITAWTLPRSFGRAEPSSSAAPVRPVVALRTKRSLVRVAAAAALFVLPMAGLAQVVSYAARHPDMPGHEIAVRIVAPFRRGESVPLQQRAIGPRPLGRVLAVSAPIVGDARQARVLSDGRVLVNDIVRRQIFVLDSTLANPTVVFDSAGVPESSYGTVARRPSRDFFPTFFGFRGDSIIFVPYVTQRWLVLDPALRLVRRDSAPLIVASPALQLRDGSERWSGAFGVLSPFPRCASGPSPGPRCADLIVSINPDSRASDTLPAFPVPSVADGLSGNSGRWVVVSDGSVAILHVRDYRIEWINPDRTRTVGPRIPYEWRVLDLRARTGIADSVNAERRERYQATLAAWRLDSADVVNGRPWNPRLPVSGGGAGGGIVPSVVDTSGRGRGGQGAAAVTGRGIPVRPASPTPAGPRVTQEYITDGRRVEGRPELPEIVRADAYPDSIPPVDGAWINAMLPDRDNRVWIRTGAWVIPAGGPLRYDIVDRSSQLVDRIEVPADQTVIGFGAGGVVILAVPSGGAYTLRKVLFR